MKIVIATAIYYPMINGVAVFSHNLAAGLARRGHEVMVLTPSQTKKSYTRTIDGVRVVYLKSKALNVYPDQIHAVPPRKRLGRMKLPRLWYRHGFKVVPFPEKAVKKALGDFRPDVVHVQVSDPIGIAVVRYAKKNQIPVVTTEHNQPEVFTGPLKVPKILKKPVNVGLTRYFVARQRKSDFVTMPTKLAIEKMILSQKKPFLVPVAAVSNGVDLTNFKPGKVADGFYQKYNLDKERSVVLYVGRVDPEKNISAVIKAFSRVHERIPEAVLVIAGDGVDKAHLVNLTKQLKLEEAVRFLGRVLPPDLYELYRAGDVFVTASEIETQGIVLIEAAASGLPLVAVNGGAVAEICRDKQNGFLLEPGDVHSMSGAICKILLDDELRKKMSEKSVEIAHKHDFEKTLDQFINIYNRVISKKR